MYAPYTFMPSMHVQGQLYHLYSTFKILHLGDTSNSMKNHIWQTLASLLHLQLVVPTVYAIPVKLTRWSSVRFLCLIPVKCPDVSEHNCLHPWDDLNGSVACWSDFPPYHFSIRPNWFSHPKNGGSISIRNVGTIKPLQMQKLLRRPSCDAESPHKLSSLSREIKDDSVIQLVTGNTISS
jgi:hypothetical protein